MKELLLVKDLTIYFDDSKGNRIYGLNSVSFNIYFDEIFSIVGESGSGKSIFSMFLLGLLPKNAVVTGSVIFTYETKNSHISVDLVKLSQNEFRKLRNKYISIILQNPMSALNPSYTVGNQIAECIIAHNKNIHKKEIKNKVYNILKTLHFTNVEDLYDKYPFQLSGGQKQRIVIGISIANNAKLIVADEPTTALDVTIQTAILELLKTIKKEYKLSIILVTHDMGVVAGYADRIGVLYRSELVEIGNIDDIYYHTRMPYTKGLLSSVVDISKPIDNKFRFSVIKGNITTVYKIVNKCIFADRCDYVEKICHEKKPIFEKISDSHMSKCLLIDKIFKNHE